jgi:ribose 5-phosphate isomerase B
MLIALGADHAGWELKEHLKAWLFERGHQVLDFGTHSPESVDYPDYALQVCEAINAGKAERGLLVCGTGIGIAMAANKVAGIRAAPCMDTFTARMSREHNDANVLALGARMTGRETAADILDVWIQSEFAGGRHQRRIEKMTALEHRHPTNTANAPLPGEAQPKANRPPLPREAQPKASRPPLPREAQPKASRPPDTPAPTESRRA